MPNARDIANGPDASFLLIGDSGTHKTWFIGTCPQPIYVFDFDKGMAIHAGKDIEYDTFKELPHGEKPRGGMYEYGTAWPAFMKKLNEIGRQMDEGKCPFKTLGFDSLTFMADICQSFILKQNNRPGKHMEIQDWGAFLNNLSVAIGNLVSWPGVKVMTAHIRRMENDLTKLEEKLPMIAGQMGGKVSTFFDEVYFCNAATKKTGTPPNTKEELIFSLQTMPDSVVRQAKSRRWNVPNGTPTDFREIARIAGLKL